jgi:hypothetical protein
MDRKRVAGRFVREETVEEEPGGAAETPVRTSAPRPKYCRTYTRKRVAEALPEIVERFIAEAKRGSVPHAKALANLGGLDKGDVVPKVKKRRGKSLAGILLDELKKPPAR